ncbi:MAG TPA: toll/interleukin-1 receptor domain-containing protein [Candidatus Dormibacteraeota bacterium]|nr:toll/interleukin-1 receptor domain-containing protein [Candidatus Dormibacteraeota bacterium]
MMKAGEKIRLINLCARTLAIADWKEIDFILNMCGIRTPISWEGERYDYVRETLRSQNPSAETLRGLEEHLSFEEGAGTELVDDDGLWDLGAVRVFLSHSAEHKEFVAKVADALQLHGLHGFVAHDAIAVNREWQAEIERALRTAQVLVGFVHPEFISSAWANQEVGWAYGRGLPVFMVRLGADPKGFPGKTQWPSMPSAKPEVVAGRITQWLNSLPDFADTIAGRLIMALRESRNYEDSGRAAEALNALNDLSPDQWKELDQVYLDNDQVHGGVLAHRGLDALYRRHHRKYPDTVSKSQP